MSNLYLKELSGQYNEIYHKNLNDIPLIFKAYIYHKKL